MIRLKAQTHLLCGYHHQLVLAYAQSHQEIVMQVLEYQLSCRGLGKWQLYSSA